MFSSTFSWSSDADESTGWSPSSIIDDQWLCKTSYELGLARLLYQEECYKVYNMVFGLSSNTYKICRGFITVIARACFAYLRKRNLIFFRHNLISCTSLPSVFMQSNLARLWWEYFVSRSSQNKAHGKSFEVFPQESHLWASRDWVHMFHIWLM